MCPARASKAERCRRCSTWFSGDAPAPLLAPPPALHAWPRFVHRQRAPAQLLAVQTGNGVERLLPARHFHETKSLALPGEQLAHQLHRPNLPERLEQTLNLSFRRVGPQVADEDV